MTHAQKPSIDSEMHELNAEADFLEQKTTVSPGGANGEDTKVQPHNSDPDAQAMVIESLRTQVQDLFSQVSQLNNKLVRSYDRVSDLEDELHVTSSNYRQSTLKISQLELERTQHLSALSTGLLVEKSHVTAELTRLMEKATEEAARRGQAETARAEIEKDLDDLSAGLFAQANNMVAEARIAEAKSNRKLEETEAALRSAEEVVGLLQAQMQALQSEREQADRRMEEMRIRMGKGKWVDRGLEGTRSSRPRLLSLHLPYHEYLIFISHLRAIRPASAQPPAMSTLLPLPFLARLVAEDCDPTVRLDLAPSLNWLSRRSVIGAIHSGQLTVEPMPFATLLEELAPPSIPTSSHHTHIVCALCGMPIYSSNDSGASTPTTPNQLRTSSQSASWSTTLFKNVRSGEINISTPFMGHRHSAQFGPPSAEAPSQVYIFRLEATSSGLPVALPLSQQPGSPARHAIYPLCTTGWCLARLRATCSLWAFVRTSIVEKVWEEPLISTHVNGTAKPTLSSIEKKHDSPNGVTTDDNKETAMQPPPRRQKVGGAFGSLWGSMQRSLSGSTQPGKEKEASNTPAGPKQEKPKLPPRDPSRKALPPPPPIHPSITYSPKNSISHVQTGSVTSANPILPPPAASASPVPPPLPKRNRERGGTAEQKAQLNGGAHSSSGSAEAERPKASSPEPIVLSQEEHTPVPQEDTSSTSDESRDGDTVDAPTEPSAPSKPQLLIPASPVSRATSNDSFTTPTEDLAPQLDIFSSQNSGLPPTEEQSSDKTPTTEKPPIAEAEVPSSDSHATEAAATPRIPAVPAVTVEDKPPSRSGSPAPPPLPRRAAARARTSSTLVPQEGELVERDSVDLPSITSEAPDTATSGDPATITDEVPTSTPTASPDVPSPSGEDAMAGTVTEEPEQTEGMAPVLISNEAQATEEVPAVLGEAEQQQPEVTASVEPIQEKASVANGSVPSADAESLPEPPPVYTVVEASGEKQELKEEGKVAVVEEPDNGQYVGDATWEERTYKELMRLREEMFWARIGTVVH